MFSIRNSDELGFRSSEGGMEDNELEEGEAVSCHDDEFVDPDVAFSYIDEKLQDLLGHFRKDFDGEVSAENLGSKFGGYGSFLPTSQRSPAISSQHKSPLKSPNPTISKSPFKSSPEKPPVSRSTPPFKNSCAPYVDSNKFKSVINGSDRKSLKVRIKVGPNNTLTRSNAAIYSGLGLDTSPSSSPEDNPEACQGLPLRARDAPGESPSTILQAMTSFSVPGGYVLSPLITHLSQWTKNGFVNNRKDGSRAESDAIPIKETEDYLENDKRLSLKKDRVMEEDNLDHKTNTARKLNKEIDVNVSTSNQAVSNSMKMPLKSCSRKANPKAERLFVGNSVRDFDKSSKLFDGISKRTMTKKMSSPDSAKVVEQVKLKKTAKVASSKGKLISKSSLSEKEIKETNLSRHKDTLSNTQEENNTNHKIGDNRKSTVEHKCTYDHGSIAAKPSKPLSAHKGVSNNRHAKSMLQRIDKNQGSKIRQKRNQNDGTPSKELFQTNSPQKIPSYVMSAGKKKSSHSTREDDKSNTSISHKLTKKRHLKPSISDVDAEGVENTLMLSVKFTETKKNARIHPEPPESFAFDSNFDAAVASTAPAVINDNWVCCDKCGEWRLLPYEQDPNNLPKEWLCKMQYWLPGLNKCYISQDVTTKAFNERFPVPAPAPALATEAGAKLDVHHDINPANNTQQSDLVLDQDTKTFSNTAKKKTGLSTLDANKTLKLKRKLQSDQIDSSDRPPETNLSFKAVLCKSADFNTDKNIHKFNERLQSQGQYSDGEELVEKSSRVLNSNSKREFSQEEFKPPKKIKKEKSETDYMLESVVARASNGLPMKISGKIMRKNSDHSSSNDLKGELGGKPSTFINKSKDTHLIGNHKDKLNYDKSDIHEYAAKKRKVKEWQESQQAQKDTVTSSKKHTFYAKECSPEVEPMTQKKTKSSSFDKGSNTNISNEKLGKSDGSTKKMLPTTATTSSSSKVSSSRKRKMGSPVESVSSSPFRTSIANKFTIRSCKDMVNPYSSLTRSRNRCSEGEVGSDQSGMQIKGTDNSVFHIKMAEDSLGEPFFKTEAKSRLLHAECEEINDIIDAEKDYYDSEGPHNLNNHHHSTGNSNYRNADKDVNRRTLKSDVNSSIMTEAPDSDGKKIDLYVKKNVGGCHNESFKSHELLKDDKKSDTLTSHQLTLNIIDNKPEKITGDKKIPSELIQASKDKCEAQSSGSQVVVHTPTNNDVTNSHELTFAKHSQMPESHGGMHLNNSSQKASGRECSLMTIADAVIKNARGLKHTANRMKSDGKHHESIGIYFEAALQFLHGSFLMEPLNENAATHKESNQAITMMNMYSDTAKLFEYCAHEYETFKQMAGVALAFKCVEVAYMKVAYFRHATASKDRLELQTSLQTILPGESPSSSASDVDNLNHNGAVDKIVSAKAANSPQNAGNHIISARHRPNFVRLLEYTEYLNWAFDATRRSQNAISAASIGMEKDGVDRLGSVRQALDFNFHNIEKLLQLIRISKESINL